MAYQVLARKWRPKKFSDLVGQEHVVKALVNALSTGRLHHAYLLTGTRGVGKTTIARILAKSLNCPNAEQGEPCGICPSCQQIDHGRYVDVLEIDAASNTGVENIREVLENAQYAPTMGRYKVYIIDEVHMLSKNAFNAMLKTLEEPPEHVKFILATTDPHKVPITVLSRCLQFVLKNLSGQKISEYLSYILSSEQIIYENQALQLLGRVANGSMRDALSLLDQAIAMGSGRVCEQDVRQMIGAVDQSYLYIMLDAILHGDSVKLLQQADEIANKAIGFDNVLNELASLLQRIALYQVAPNAVQQDFADYQDSFQRLSGSLGSEQIQLYYQCVICGRRDLSLAPDEYTGFVMTLLRMLAFAPLAAKTLAIDDEVYGTELHNPPSVPQIIESNDTTVNQSKLAETPHHVVQVAHTTLLPPEITPSIQHIEKQSISSEQDAGNQGDSGIIDMVEENQIVDDALLVNSDNLASPQIQAIKPSSSTDENLVQSFDNSEFLPILNQNNWQDIVEQLADKLGSIHMFIRHTAIVSFDSTTGILQLALTEEGQISADDMRLRKLEKILSESYQRSIHVVADSWNEESGLETQAMQNQRLQQEQVEQARQILEKDVAIQDLKKQFSAQFLDDTLKLKNT